MKKTTMTIALASASLIGAQTALANTNFTIINACNNWVKISSVHAQIGNMHCTVLGNPQGTNADFYLQTGEVAECEFTTTHGITNVAFTMSDHNPLQTAEVVVNNVGVVVVPLVNPIAHKSDGNVKATCDF